MKITGIVLIVLQILGLAGGMLEESRMAPEGIAGIGYMLGFFLPGIIGVILLIKGIQKEKSKET